MKKYKNFINEGYEYDNSGEVTKLIYRDPVTDFDMSDVDPYGEEEWVENDKKLNWNEIKIVHPRAYMDKKNVKKRVLIVPNSEYYGLDPSNPADVFGTIVSAHNDNRDHCFDVDWDNGNDNQYREEDLIEIKLIKAKPLEVKASSFGFRTFEQFSEEGDHDDVDPYGEEQWDEPKLIDWSNMKKVHPKQHDVGSRVAIDPDSHFYGGDTSNPADISGTITDYREEDWGDDLPFDVTWDNGTTNCYNDKDLVLLD